MLFYKCMFLCVKLQLNVIIRFCLTQFTNEWHVNQREEKKIKTRLFKKKTDTDFISFRRNSYRVANCTEKNRFLFLKLNEGK